MLVGFEFKDCISQRELSGKTREVHEECVQKFQGHLSLLSLEMCYHEPQTSAREFTQKPENMYTGNKMHTHTAFCSVHPLYVLA